MPIYDVMYMYNTFVGIFYMYIWVTINTKPTKPIPNLPNLVHYVVQYIGLVFIVYKYQT